MLTSIDHLVIAVADPDGAAAELEASLGLRATGGGRHERLGTFNRLVWLGDSYLELIGVWDRTLAETSWIGGPTVRALGHGGGLVTFALASDALAEDVERLRTAGARLEGPLSGERLRPDGGLARWQVAAPSRLDPEQPPFLIGHDASAAEWTPGERAARMAALHPIGARVRLDVLELAVSDVARVSLRDLRTVGLQFRPSLAGHGARDAAVGAQTVRLRPIAPGSPEQTTIVLRAIDATVDATRDIRLLGCRWVIRPSP